MKPLDLAALALESVRTHRLRTGLTLLAIGIGVTAVLLLTALGEGAKRYVVDQFAAIGTNLVIVLPGRTETGGMGTAADVGTRDLTIDDADAIARRASSAVCVAPLAVASGAVEWGGRSRSVYVVGATPEYWRIRDLPLASGRILPPGDARRGEPVAVIGAAVAREVFRGASPLGQPVRIGGVRYRVIGTLAPKGVSLGVNMDEIAIVPLASLMAAYGQTSLHRVMVQARSVAEIPSVQEQVREILVDRHRDEDFTMITADAMLASFRSILDALTWALAGIAAISLAVAGIGIMNVLLVSVSERVGEIGLLKALGATPGLILRLFVAEALMLTTLGLLLGTALGAAGIALARVLWPAFPVSLGGAWLVTTTLFALAAGAVFGFLPARRAATLDAADALRRSR